MEVKRSLNPKLADLKAMHAIPTSFASLGKGIVFLPRRLPAAAGRRPPGLPRLSALKRPVFCENAFGEHSVQPRKGASFSHTVSTVIKSMVESETRLMDWGPRVALLRVRLS